MSGFKAVVDDDLDITRRVLDIVATRALHVGFFVIALGPEKMPDGFAVYCLSITDPVGVGQKLGRVHAYATSFKGELVWQSGIFDKGDNGCDLRPKIVEHLELFAKLVGPTTFQAFIDRMWQGSSEVPAHSSVGIIDSVASFFCNIGPERQRLFYPLGRFVERLRSDPLLGEQAEPKPHVVLLNLFGQHLKELLPR